MAFQVETGAGTPGSNSYTTTAFALAYLTDRGRETENSWSTIATALQEEALVVGTQYIDTRYGDLFKGVRLRGAIEGRVASGTLTLSLLPTEDEDVTIGQKTYRLRDTLAQEDDVLIGATVSATIDNLVAAVNGTGSSVTVEEHTLPHYEVIATNQSDTLVVSAAVAGENGNEIVTTENLANGSWASATLVDGLDEAPQPLEFPRSGLFAEGRRVVGIPLKLKQATVEYAVRSLGSAGLDPDPTYDDTYARVIRTRTKAGPIEDEVEYAGGGVPVLTRAYPAVDRLLSVYLTSGGGTYR